MSVERARGAGRPRASRWRRQLRGVLLLLALLWVPTSVVLAVLHVLLWISVLLAVLTLAAVLVWLRFEARADRARARSARGPRHSSVAAGDSRSKGRRDDDRRAPSRPGREARSGARSQVRSEDTEVIHLGARPAAVNATDAPAAARATAATAGTATAAAAGTATATTPAGIATPAAHTDERARAEGRVRREAGSAAYDFEAELARDAAAAPAPRPAPEGTWSPVPVPRPTYTMKAKAEPRMTSSGVPADVFATPEFAEEAEELDERARFARRAAGS